MIIIDVFTVSAMIAPPVEAEGKSVFETIKKRPLDKKKRHKNDCPEDVTGFLGPWGGFEGERRLDYTTFAFNNSLIIINK